LLAQNIDLSILKQREDELKKIQKNTFKLIADEYRKTEELEPSTQRRNQFVWDKLYVAIGGYTPEFKSKRLNTDYRTRIFCN
jgi:hypothetical protein